MSGVIMPYLEPKGEHQGKIEVIDINSKKQTPTSDRLEIEVERLRSVVTRLSRAIFALVCFDIATIAIVIHLVTK